jgi:hypothetical protein
MRLILWPLLLILLTACASQDTERLAEQNVRELQAELTTKHPAAYLRLAQALFQQGKKDQAARMYYVGQIRYRAYLNTLPKIEATAEEAKYEELKAEIGDEINEYAARNLDNWVRLLDSAVNWHQTHPNEFLPKDEYSLLYELTLYNFNRLREYIVENKALIRAQRAQQGLVNEY